MAKTVKQETGEYTVKKIIIILTLTAIISIMVAGCATQEKATQEKTTQKKDYPEMNFCKQDSDCICGGTDSKGRCFLGNKKMYNEYVDKDAVCPDFCGGFDGRLTIRCVDKKCVQLYECIMDADCESGSCVKNRCTKDVECKTDKDCSKTGCSGTICAPKDESVITTCEWKEEYRCFRSMECGCVQGICKFKDQKAIDICVANNKA